MSHRFLDNYLQDVRSPWTEEMVTSAALEFACNPKAFIKKAVKPSLGVGRPMWIQMESGLLSDDPDEVLTGYRAYFKELYSLPTE